MITSDLAAAIPDTLRKLDQWICWKLGKSAKGTPTKTPINPNGRGLASTTNPATWAPFEKALDKALKRNLGIGFVFTLEAGIVGIDLDHVRDAATGEIVGWAAKAIYDLDSYAELSPSGTGVHVFVKAKLPHGGSRGEHVEMYSEGRYFTVTGQHLQGTPAQIKPRQAALDALYAQMFGPKSRQDLL